MFFFQYTLLRKNRFMHYWMWTVIIWIFNTCQKYEHNIWPISHLYGLCLWLGWALHILCHIFTFALVIKFMISYNEVNLQLHNLNRRKKGGRTTTCWNLPSGLGRQTNFGVTVMLPKHLHKVLSIFLLHMFDEM